MVLIAVHGTASRLLPAERGTRRSGFALRPDDIELVASVTADLVVEPVA